MFAGQVPCEFGTHLPREGIGGVFSVGRRKTALTANVSLSVLASMGTRGRRSVSPVVRANATSGGYTRARGRNRGESSARTTVTVSRHRFRASGSESDSGSRNNSRWSARFFGWRESKCRAVTTNRSVRPGSVPRTKNMKDLAPWSRNLVTRVAGCPCNGTSPSKGATVVFACGKSVSSCGPNS